MKPRAVAGRYPTGANDQSANGHGSVRTNCWSTLSLPWAIRAASLTYPYASPSPATNEPFQMPSAPVASDAVTARVTASRAFNHVDSRVDLQSLQARRYPGLLILLQQLATVPAQIGAASCARVWDLIAHDAAP